MTCLKKFFVSDLHLFTRRSRAADYEPALREAASRAEIFVLGGDIFDFGWTTLGSVEPTIAAAIRWIESLATDHPQCVFQYLVGNHDCNRDFLLRLDDLSRRLPNLSWHRYFLRSDENVFLHGDVVDKSNLDHTSLALRRFKHDHSKTKSRLAHSLYDLAIASRIHLAGHLVNRNQRVTGRILRYLRGIGHGPETGVKHVYFGHTHRALDRLQMHGMTFHNGGAPFPGLRFRIVEIVPSN